MNRKLIFIFIFMCIIFSFSGIEVFAVQGAGEFLALQGESAILLELKSNKILYEHNAHEIMYPASTTKILTALLAIEYGDLEEQVTVGPEILMIPKDSSKAGLVLGEQITLADLIRGLLLPSGNDAANTIAVHIARKISDGDKELDVHEALEKFAALMNQRARELGATSSHFTNAHGYHDPDHYTTAYDLAQIAKEAMKQKFFRQVVMLDKYQGEGFLGDTPVVHLWKNTNELIHPGGPRYFPSATGIKTGFTTPAGFCLVSSAAKGELEFISVVLRTSLEGRWSDSRRLLSYGLDNYAYYQLLSSGQAVAEIKVANAHSQERDVIEALAVEEFGGVFHVKEIAQMEKEILLAEELKAETPEGTLGILAPLKQGQELGTVVYRLQGEIIAQSPLVASRDVASNSILRNLLGGKYSPHVLGWGGLGVISLVFFLIFIASRPGKGRRLRRKTRGIKGI